MSESESEPASEGMDRRAVVVFCGSRHGSDPAYADAARELGDEIARRGYDLVYGGARVGLMGIVADAALAAGGRVVGVIPGLLVDLEVAHLGLTEIHIVDSMANRKVELLRRADLVVCLAGGLGTLDELFEALTWNQLHLHPRGVHLGIGLVDTLGAWQPTVEVVRQCCERGFAEPGHLERLVVAPTAAAVLNGLDRLIEQPDGTGGTLSP